MTGLREHLTLKLSFELCFKGGGILALRLRKGVSRIVLVEPSAELSFYSEPPPSPFLLNYSYSGARPEIPPALMGDHNLDRSWTRVNIESTYLWLDPVTRLA